MNNVILNTNAIPVYGFLSRIHANAEGRPLDGCKILDCGAGGAVPPLVLFRQHGMEAWGIDTSEAQLDRADQFCQEHGIELDLRPGDMRQLPFEDAFFDYVYEHYSMCHLSKADTAVAISEMHRVLKPEGLCFLGVISMDSWPRSHFGQETRPGEFCMERTEGDSISHTMFADVEADALVANWEVLSKEKQVIHLLRPAEETTLEAWMDLREEASRPHSPAEWKAKYQRRTDYFQYVHTYYLLQKP